MALSKRYLEYINSPEWKAKSRAFCNERGRCNNCKSTADLQSHHLTYVRLGCELPEDIEVLCKSCHDERTDLIRNPPKHARGQRFVKLGLSVQNTRIRLHIYGKVSYLERWQRLVSKKKGRKVGHIKPDEEVMELQNNQAFVVLDMIRDRMQRAALERGYW